MATKGENIRNKIRTIIDNPKLKSTVVVTHITRTQGSRGGYDGVSEETTSTTTINAIPSGVISPRMGFESVGDVKEGDMVLLVRDDADVDTDDKITCQDDEWHVREVRPVAFNQDSDGNNINAAKNLILSKIQ